MGRFPNIVFYCSQFFLLQLVFSHLSFAQNNIVAHIREISEAEGLQYRNINCTYQDSLHFLWIGTLHGLVKFDGYNFAYFTKEKNGLATNRIHEIIEDEAGMLWLITYVENIRKCEVAEITLFDTKTERVVSPDKWPGQTWEILQSMQLYGIKSSVHHRINLFDRNFNFRPYDPGRGLLSLESIAGANAKGGEIKCFFQTNQDHFSLSQAFYKAGFINGMWQRMDGTDHSFEILHRFPDNTYLMADVFRGDDIFYTWNPKTGSKLFELPSSLTTEYGYLREPVYFPEDGALWFGSEHKLFVYYPETGDFLDLKKEYPHFFERKTIFHINRGASGKVFVGTNDGLYIIQLKVNRFKLYLHKHPSVFSAPQWHSVRNIHQFGDYLVVGTYPYKMFMIDTEHDTITVSRPARIPIPMMPYQDEILAFESARDVLKINLIDLGKKVLSKGDRLPFVWAIHPIRDSLVLLGSEEGLWEWSFQTSTTRPYDKTNEFANINSALIYQIFDLGNEEFLLATSKGIFEMNFENGITAQYWTGGKDGYSLPYDDVAHICPVISKKDNYWVSTLGGGLVKWDKTNGKTQQYTTEDGLSSNIIYAAYTDEEGMLWIPTYSGLSAFDPQSELFRIFLEKDGISHNEFNRTAHLQAPDGRLFFGGLNGITSFYPQELKKQHNSIPPPIYITSFTQYDENKNQVIDQTNLFKKEGHIIVRPQYSFLNLTVALLDFSDPSLIRYDYRFNGRNMDWHPLAGNALELNSLPYGHDTLIIRGQILNDQNLIQTLIFQ